MSFKNLKKLTKPKAKTLITTINDFLKSSISPHYKGNPSIKPSSLGSPCYRKNYYSFFRVEPDQDFTPENLKVFALGDAVHDVVKEWLIKSGVIIEYRNKGDGNIPKHWKTGRPDPEFPIESKEYVISKGKIDGIGIFDGKLWLYEFKSINDKGFTELKAPKEAHAIQATLYLKVFEDCLKAGNYKHIPELKEHTELAGIRYLYVNKNDMGFKEFVVPRETALNFFVMVEEKIQKVLKAALDKELPEKTWDFCQGCPYSIKCRNDFNDIE